ncbi:Helicase MOV-10 [Pleodorina starrii]|uniref:RNA helicase n=1 Tax=Pleodorina starrii TaxID=330485 RepID=A0A9W6EX92_9CHLO|nr:Helicase MOV-10 [Pleodorina starrii]GLC48194.1 Helicase MOV-10 [Pleodorina starrii]GLC67439.1 Helicase MOV-10 [Pleodorina starrii]
MDPRKAAADEVAVVEFIKKFYARHPGAAPGINFHFFKTTCKCFRALRYADIRAWFKSRPQAYTVIGQLVVPHGIAAELPTAVAETTTAAAPAAIPAAVLTALTVPSPAAQLSLYCSICRIRCTSEDNMRDHLRGARHRDALSAADAHALEEAVLRSSQEPAATGCSHCELCGKWFNRPDLFRNHVASSAHKARVFWLLLRRSAALAPGADAVGRGIAPSGSASGAAPDATDPRVSVSSLPHPLPAVAPGATARHTLTLRNRGPGSIKLRSVSFLTPVPDGSMRLEDLHGVTAQPSGTVVWLSEGSSYEVVLVLEPRAMGLMRNLIILDMAPMGPVARPVAGVCCPPDLPPPPPPGADAGQAAAAQRRPKGLAPVNKDVVKGIPPPGSQEHLPLPLPMQPLPVPSQLRQLVGTANWAELKRLVPPLGEVQGQAQYAERLQKLLWLEELQHEIDIRVYDMKGVTLLKAGSGGRLALEVPGLAENRPSVLKGDRLLVTPSDRSAGGREYEGYVHVVQKETVLLGFADSFTRDVWIAGRRFDVRFTVNRSAFNLMQNALLRARDPRQLSPHLVLPGSKAAPLPTRPPPGLPLVEPPGGDGGAGRLTWQNGTLNNEQKLAVREVLRGEHAPLPYLIFGPPGTGKTSTLVEAAKQLLLTRPSSRLLLVAPSNSAADLLIQSLSATSGGAANRTMTRRLGPGGCLLMRLCAYSRPLEDLPKDLRDQAEEHGLRPHRGLGGGGGGGSPGGLGAGGAHVCAVNWDSEAAAFLMPPRDMLMDPRLRVVAASCAMAAKLVHAGLPVGHFSHILVDEAGHAEEPLLLCSLAGLAPQLGQGKQQLGGGSGSGGTRVVMAGDPRQLGPVILSLFAKQYGGLDVSLMERLLEQSGGPYGRTKTGPQVQRSSQPAPLSAGSQLPASPPSYASAYITKLLSNYRSHPAILRVPNATFYDDELRCAASPETVNSMLLWEELPNPRVPMLMHHIVGKDEQEANSPSWQNMLEARQVVDYVQKLLAKRRGGRVSADEIGIISPYKKQVQRIRVLLRELRDHIKVGSVEEFQGQERRIIIISTVRSSDEYLDFDSRHRLGFLSNPKRFNVAVTRAKALLVLVGNAQILAQDKHWRALLRYMRAAGAIVGQALPPKVAERLDGPPTAEDQEEEDEEEAARAAGEGGGTAQVDALARLLQQLVLGSEVRPPSEEDNAAMMTRGAVVQVEGGEMRRFD